MNLQQQSAMIPQFPSNKSGLASMHAGRQIFSLDSLLNLNIADQIFLDKIEKNLFDEDEYFKKIKSKCDFNFIVKIANASPRFERLCNQEKYNQFWKEQYETMGFLISNGQINFKSHQSDCFDLLRGALFFYYSQLERHKASSKDITSGEKLFLLRAIKYKSVHAMQRYHFHLFNAKTSNDERKQDFEAAIGNCKSILELYGSYAYLMLAEVYFHYAVWFNQQQAESPVSLINSALKCCMYAADFLEKSTNSTHNASLGKGIEASNSMNLSPESFAELISNWMQNKLNEDPAQPRVLGL